MIVNCMLNPEAGASAKNGEFAGKKDFRKYHPSGEVQLQFSSLEPQFCLILLEEDFLKQFISDVKSKTRAAVYVN